jgi:hypothetical protein
MSFKYAFKCNDQKIAKRLRESASQISFLMAQLVMDELAGYVLNHARAETCGLDLKMKEVDFQFFKSRFKGEECYLMAHDELVHVWLKRPCPGVAEPKDDHEPTRYTKEHPDVQEWLKAIGTRLIEDRITLERGGYVKSEMRPGKHFSMHMDESGIWFELVRDDLE